MEPDDESGTTTGVLSIRPIGRGDVPAAARLTGELGYPVDAEPLARRLEAIERAGDHAVFVACLGDAVVGWIHVAIVHHLQADPRAEIGGLVVADGVRSRGIGARLLATAEAWAAGRGVPSMLVRSQVMREAAHRFYERAGYTRTKTSAVFSKSLSTS